MEEDNVGFLIFAVFLILLFVIFFVGMLALDGVSTQEKNEKESLCKKVGEKTGLEFYSYERCDPLSGCDIICKYINSQGDIVLKEVK